MPVTASSRSPVWIAATVIALRVSVPVLSEQMTPTVPSVSTAGSRRIIALRPAMRCTPIARVMVMIAGRPSGIAATARPTEARNISVAVKSRTRTPKAKLAEASTRIAAVSQRPNWAICRSSGVVSCCTFATMALMRPISVAAPVATTMPAPWPWVTRVPE